MIAPPWYERPRLWAITYIALVPLFGLLLTALPHGSFFDSNIQREASVRHDAASLRRSLASALISQASAASWHSESSTFTIERRSINVPSSQVTADGSF